MAKLYQAIKSKRGSIAVLDIGSSKVACLIAEPNHEGQLHITGIGNHLSRGIRGGHIISASEVEESIASAVHTAETMAGNDQVENVIVSISGGDIKSHLFSAELNISGESVTDQDVSDILREGTRSLSEDPENRNKSIIQCIATNYVLDGTRGIKDPRTMFGTTLEAELHILTADSIKLRNLAGCVARTHLNISEFVVAHHAAALGVLEEDEMELGVTVIDMGSMETGFAMFSGGRNIFSGTVQIGGQHVTNDIAKGLSTSLSNAEQVKILQGSVFHTPKDAQAMITVPQIGEEDDGDDASTIPRSDLIGIIKPRLEETFEMIRDKMQESGLEKQAGRHVVLTGGASQIMGLRELASRTLGKQIRIGKPRMIPGLAESASGPAFATAIGMIYHATHHPFEDDLFDSSKRNSSGLGNRMQRLVGWIRENV
ncbi:MAG: cell division protein FtsA [Rickettsiales bacterium]